MNPEELKQAWQTQSSQTKLTIDADLLLQEVRRSQQYFTAMLFWRDAREVGLTIVMVPLWIWLGLKTSIPWTWYLTVPVLVWTGGFMLVHRIRHKPLPQAIGEPLRQRVASSLDQIDQQIWLLRNVFWWSVLPISLSIFAFVGHIAWLERAGGWWNVLVIALVALPAAIVFTSVYLLNQTAVRTELLPRRQELQTLLASLHDEPPPPTA